MDELETLVDQLDEVLTEGIDDAEDAMELAVIAGGVALLGGSDEVLADAVAYRDGQGQAALEEAWKEVNLDGVLEVIEDGSMGGELGDLEEAVLDLDDLMAAAIWCKRTDVVLPYVRKVAAMVRELPDAFAPLADYGARYLALPTVAQHLDVFDVWVAIAEAGAWAEDDGAWSEDA